MDSNLGEDLMASDTGIMTRNYSQVPAGSAASVGSLDDYEEGDDEAEVPGSRRSRRRRRRDNAPSSRDPRLHQLPLLLQIDWVLHNIVNSMAPIVSLVYWTMLYDG